MQTKIVLRLINLTLALALLLRIPHATFSQVDDSADMTNPAGETLTVAGVSAAGEYTASGSGASVVPGVFAPASLARQDYQNVYDQAMGLLNVGMDFRGELQVPPPCTTPDECRRNYQDYNDGTLFYGFCTNYDAIDARGYCPGDDPSPWPLPSAQVRGQLVRARSLFGYLALAEPADTQVGVGNNQLISIRDVGRTGVLSATREIANIHMLFGNEFLVDATDYRFSGGDPRADQIIAEEIAQLKLAQQQFELAVGVLAHAFNADFGGPSGGFIGDYFGPREFELFGIVSERMVAAIGELADRYRQLGQNQKALDLYAEAFANQYVQAMALAVSAAQQNASFAENGGWEILTNLESLRARAQAIHDGINPFGFVDEYVPLQTYDELRSLVRNDFLRDATEDENTAENAQREFDRNRTALNQELQNLRLTYESQLLELCGQSEDDFETCDEEGGLMRQNFNTIGQAFQRVLLVQRRLANLSQQMEIEQERAGQIIDITLANGETMALLEYERGVINSYRVTEAVVESQSDETYYGGELRSTASFGISFPPGKDASIFGVSFQTSVSAFGGYRHSSGTVSSISTVWDPAAEELGAIASLQVLQNTATEAQIIGANSAAVIKTLMLQQAELLIELDIAIREWNRLVDEHQRLKERYHHLLNLRAQARADLVDNYLNNPAYRILRDQATVEAERSHGLAGQFAYLTAKALEYEFLVRYPKLGDVFKARTADDIDNFLNDLEAFRTAIGSPGQRNRYPYRISLARDLLGLSDENLDPQSQLSATERARLRFDGFQQVLQQNVITDTTSGAVIAIEIPFSTSLLDNRIFTPNVWNNRIAGVGLPADVPNTQGIAVNLLSRQFGELGTPEVQLTHGGHASYRTATGNIVEYVPENAKLSGYVTPQGFESKATTATVLASVNGNGQGTPSSALFNRSVAASNWTLRIDLKSPFNSQLDIAQLEDIEVQIDTTGVALGNRTREAQADAQKLQAEFQ